ncbi:hypothetical protein CN931_28415 [Bacillus sp. AFS054943]|uniref:Uncharacterized protein n=1 Tax=Bacillus cereus TaxID=1396 RepID=A0A2C1LHH2_BACCE|nr:MULTISPECIES: hypothetical protein [Bacillus]PGL74972.1 hypothetical protein CN931_28415 [Bacillus sp. AFS054943]PGT97348.1 hypothetical protein COD19_25440 [Bacillus cereus]TKI39108.1 hypothetical protein FC700_21870 [Bacillus mycoides]
MNFEKLDVIVGRVLERRYAIKFYSSEQFYLIVFNDKSHAVNVHITLNNIMFAMKYNMLDDDFFQESISKIIEHADYVTKKQSYYYDKCETEIPCCFTYRDNVVQGTLEVLNPFRAIVDFGLCI